MLSSLGLNRRSLFGAAGTVAVAASIPVALTAAAARAAEAAEPGDLLAWLRVGPDGAVRVSLAARAPSERSGPSWLTVGSQDGVVLSLTDRPSNAPVTLHAWQCRQEACALTRTLLIGIAADRWGVLPSECQTVQAAIVHERSDRRIGYRIWTEIA